MDSIDRGEYTCVSFVRFSSLEFFLTMVVVRLVYQYHSVVIGWQESSNETS